MLNLRRARRKTVGRGTASLTYIYASLTLIQDSLQGCCNHWLKHQLDHAAILEIHIVFSVVFQYSYLFGPTPCGIRVAGSHLPCEWLTKLDEYLLRRKVIGPAGAQRS